MVRTTPGKALLPAACVAWALALGCSTGALRPPERHEDPAGGAQMRWRAVVHQYGLDVPRPEECASGALVGPRLVLGSRAGRVLAVDTADGHTLWSTPV